MKVVSQDNFDLEPHPTPMSKHYDSTYGDIVYPVLKNLHFITIFLITDVVFLINLFFLLFENKSSWEQ